MRVMAPRYEILSENTNIQEKVNGERELLPFKSST